MIKALESLQSGLQTPKSFQSFLSNHRVLNLTLSNHTKVEQFNNSGVNYLDIEKVEERYLLSGTKEGAITIHDLQNSTGNPAYTAKIISRVSRHDRHAHQYSVETVTWYPFDSGLFVSSGMDSTLKMWDTNTMKAVETFNMKHKVHCHHMSPISGRHTLIAAAMENPHAVLIDPRIGAFCHELRGHKGFVISVRWSPSCENLIATGGVDSKILLWDVRAAKGYLSSLDQHNGELGTRKKLITAHNGAVKGLCFTDDGLYLVSTGSDSRVRLWDVALSSNTLVNYGSVTNKIQYRTTGIDICCNTNPPVVFVPSLAKILAFDMFSGSRIHTLVGHFGFVHSCAYRPSTHQLFSGSLDMNILLWSPDSGQEVEEEMHSSDLREEIFNPLSANSDSWSSSEEG